MSADVTLEEIVAAMTRKLRTAGLLHMVGGKTLTEKFGAKGELTLRHWLRRFGFWRGGELRKAHMAMGLPINMESLIKNWDSASSYHLKEQWTTEASYAPYNVRSPVNKKGRGCPMSEPWIENDLWQLGHVLCDELHIQIARGYHPDAAVVIPECIMKKEEKCDFNWLMPPDSRVPEPLELYPGQAILLDWQYDDEVDKAYKCLRRSMRIAAGRIYYLWEVLKEYHPKESKEVFKQIMEMWALERALALKKEKIHSNWGERPENLFINFDYPYGIIWGIDETRVKASGIEIEISYCPFAETWNWLGGLSEMKVFCDTCYSCIATNYDTSFSAKVMRCKTNGDEYCSIRMMNSSF